MNAFNFAHQIIAGLDHQISSVSSQIADLERQLAALRESQKQLENERQGLLTLAKAGESAIEQANNFLGLAKASGRADMVDAFWSGIDGLRDEKPELPSASEPQPQSEPEPQPQPSNDGAIDVPATTIDEPIAEAQKPDTASDSADKADEKPEWHGLNWREFVKYAAAKGIKVKGRKRGEIEADLLDRKGR